MSRMVGADVEELRALAAQFSASASRLRHTAQAIRSGVHGSPWRGSIADMFRVSWDTDHSARLRAAADHLDEAAQQLTLNAAEQERTSAADGGGVSPGRSGFEVPHHPAQPMPVWIGNPPVLNQDMLDWIEGERLNSLRDGVWGSFRGFMEEMDRGIPLFNGLVPKDLIGNALQFGELVGAKVPILGKFFAGMEAIDLVGRTLSGENTLTDWIDTAGEGLMAIGQRNPVVALTGLNLQVWSMVGEEAAKVDWSADALKSTWDYAVDNPGVVVEEFGKATVTVGSKVFNMLKFWE